MKPIAVLMLYLAVMVLCHQISQQIAAAAQAPYTLVDSRDVGSNVITLRCRNSNDVFDPQAMYFLNGTRLDSLDGFQDTDRDPGTVVFQMNRRLEGEYSCGTELQRSPSLSFIAFPDSSPIPLRDPVVAVIGETARLQCGVQPGALAGQYFARWFNGTSGRTLYNYPAPSQRLADPSLEMSDSPRYNIDPSDLSLTISNVQRNDSFENYRCEVGVEDPRSPSVTTYFYELTRSHSIVFEVVAPPQIVRDFRPNTVIAEGEDIHFTCIARGYPAPAISWEHEGWRVVNGDNPHFKVNSTKRNTSGLLVTVTSFLTVSSADDSVSGDVRCIALPPPPDMVGGIALDSDDASTQLGVLGSFNELEIEITTRGDVIVIVDLPRALPIPVHLVLVYRDTENPSTRPDSKITQAAYINLTEIRHIEFASLVPFKHFTVEVGTYSRGVRGPLISAQGEFDKDRPTLRKDILSMTAIIVIGAVPGTICLVITIVLGLGCCIWHKQTLDYRVKCLMVKNPPKYLNTLQEHFEKKEDEIDIAVKEKLIHLVKAGIPQLNPDKKTKTAQFSIYGTQANGDPSTMNLLNSQTSHRLEEATDYPEFDETSRTHTRTGSEVPNHHLGNNHILLAPPSYEAAISQTGREAQEELMNLVASFVSDSVRATLHQDHDPELANQVERKVKVHVLQRQKSVDESSQNRIKQLQSLHTGTPI